MAIVRAIPLAHVPSAHAVHVSLFRDVANASHLRQQLLAGNVAFEYAFVDASSILSTAHVLAAVFRAVNDQINGRMKSRNVHSEIVFALSPNNNISQSFSNFGIPPNVSSLSGLLAIKVSTPASPITQKEIEQHLSKEIEGTPVDFSDENISSMRDLAKIRKLYKIQSSDDSKKSSRKRGLDANGNSLADVSKSTISRVGQLSELRDLEAIVIGTMALRGS